ncbi:hypothetical protein N0X72_01105 [Streptomyces carpaticus]|nr:hypothetical protein N0X72_01105 [Streptomyces carpaticus]
MTNKKSTAGPTIYPGRLPTPKPVVVPDPAGNRAERRAAAKADKKNKKS